MATRFFLLCTFLLCCFDFALATEVRDVVYEGSSEFKDKGKARKEIVNKAIEEVSMDYIKEFLGESKTHRFKTQIQNSIIANSGKYILYIKTEDYSNAEEGSQLTVLMKISPENLRELLSEKGLMYQMEGPPKVLPLISFVDKPLSLKYSWWVPNSTKVPQVVKDMMTSLNSKIADQFSTIEFYSMRPIFWDYLHLVPEPFRIDRLRQQDSLYIGESFNAEVIIRGAIDVKNNAGIDDIFHLEVKLIAYQVNNGRVVGEVTRSYVTDPGPHDLVVSKKLLEVSDATASDLKVQILDSWQKGTFGAKAVELTFKGKLDYDTVQNLKEQLSKVRSIHAVRERLFAPDSVTFEVDTANSSRALAKHFEQFAPTSLHFQLEEVDKQRITLKKVE